MSNISLPQNTLLIGSARSYYQRRARPLVANSTERQLCGLEMGDSLILRVVHAQRLSELDRLLGTLMHFPYLSRRDSFLEAVQPRGLSLRALLFARAMTPCFPIHSSPVNTLLRPFWCTTMRILGARITLFKPPIR